MVRPGEATGTTWDEIDLAAKLWTIPAARMKKRRDIASARPGRHRHPGKNAAGASPRPRLPGAKPGKPVSVISLWRRANASPPSPFPELAVTAHGLRSSFRDWAAERTSFPDEVAEQALAHSVGSKVRRSYQRGDLLAKRRQLMEAWARYCASAPSAAASADVVRCEARVVAEKRRGPSRRRRAASRAHGRRSRSSAPGSGAGLESVARNVPQALRGWQSSALVQAIELCLACRIVPEDWIATNGSACFRAWFNYDSATLDEAFGVERKGEHVDHQREKKRLRRPILFRLYQLHHLEGAPIGKTTFETVAKEFGVSWSYVNDLVYKDRKGRALAKLLRDWPIVSLAEFPKFPRRPAREIESRCVSVSSSETIAVSKHRSKSRRSRRRRRSTTSARVARVGDKVREFVAKTGVSRPTAYRMMASGNFDTSK